MLTPFESFWGADSKAKFSKGLVSDSTEEKIRSLLVDESITPVNLAKEITNLLLDYARICNLKSTKRGNKIKSDKPWFNRECVKQKNKIREFANALSRQPGDREIREKLYLEKGH